MSKYATQFEYMEALKRALTMANVPYDRAADTVAEYQQRFLDGLAAGLSEAEISAGLDEPNKIATSLRVSNDLVVFKEKKTAANFFRLFFSAIGLLIFNVFMIVPAILYSAMMFVLYIIAVVVYAAGIAVTSSSLAGVNELVFDGPVRHVVMHRHDAGDQERARVSVKVDSDGVRVQQAEPVEVNLDRDDRGGVAVTLMDEDDRSKGLFAGLGLIIGGVLLILVSLVMTRITWLGLKKYVQMHADVLRAA